VTDTEKILSENTRRNNEKNKPYNPVTGEGCRGKRELLQIKDAPFSILHLPEAMMREEVCRLLKKHESIEKLFKARKQEFNGDVLEEFWISFCELRIKYDFEFFACLYETIRHGETGEAVPFKLNLSQREFLDILEKQRTEGDPIRVIVLKARQMGLSTETQLYMYWIQNVHKTNWDSVICAHVNDASKNIRSMYALVAENMPPIAGIKRTMTPFENTQNIKLIPQRGCRITVGSAESPESVRSQNPKLAHFSEVAMYPDTTKKGTGDLIGSIIGAMKQIPYTMIVYESTAKGVGDYFHSQWTKAKAGETAFVPVFLPWYYDAQYSKPIENGYYNHSGKKVKGSIEEFVSALSDYEKNLFSAHPRCTLENINWYRAKKAEMSSDEMMMQEYPSDGEEAFRDSGMPAFRSAHIEALRKDCRLPQSIGTLSAESTPETAKTEPSKRDSILSGIRFIEDEDALKVLKSSDPLLRRRKERDKIKVWEFPDASVNVSDRYIVVFDPQKGLSEKADHGVITVFDRYWMMYGGKPEIAAQWRGKKDKDVTIWTAVQIAKWYNNALLVVESNTYDADKKNEDDAEFIFDAVAGHYYNLYSRTPADKIKDGIPAKYGFNTNRATKTMIMAGYVTMLRERGYIERDEDALNEARHYEQKQNGSYGAKNGWHDDILMTRMIGCHICYESEVPKITEERRTEKPSAPVNESSF
jgi:hypothetical protein